MSESQLAAGTIDTVESSAGDVQTIVAKEAVQSLLDALNDADCRAILDATSLEPLSAKEVSKTCGLPLSTAYRKLDLLTEAGLLEEETRICQSGKHASEYSRVVERVTVSLGRPGATKLRVVRDDETEYAGASASPTDQKRE
jgi:DNA-binding transcriptional ArsR family regulator